jgi:threonine dehydrogenase-like Zn-dependent dehydrogenase
MISHQTSKISRQSPAKYDETQKMMALQFNGKKSVKVGMVHVPKVTDPTDVVVRATALTICGSDLHLYHDEVPQLPKGYILGHESVGIVEEVGPGVKLFKKGDRVVVSAVIACGMCDYCKRGEWSCCDTTNTDLVQKELYGHNTGALFGYTETMGGYDGCQAEFIRVPFADINLFPIPANITDKQALVIADIACTGFHGAHLADVKSGDRVVVFGCGPVGLMAQMWSIYRGASQVIAIDVDEQRLQFSRDKLGCEIVNSKEVDPIKAVKTLIPGGPDKVIDCVGFRFPEGFLHKVEKAIGLETDSPNIVNTAIEMVRKNGRVTLIGDYIGYTNHFNIGAMMEKHLTINGGQLWPHKYYKFIFDAIASGKIDPTFVFTHTFPLSKGDQAYDLFDKHAFGMIKPYLIPDSIYSQQLLADQMAKTVI